MEFLSSQRRVERQEKLKQKFIWQDRHSKEIAVGCPKGKRQHSGSCAIGIKVFINIYEVGGIFMGKDGPFSSQIMVGWISLLWFFF